MPPAGSCDYIASYLNLYEEHLDYYKTLDRYFAAKANIAKFQTDDDYLFVGGNVPAMPANAPIVRIDFNDIPDYSLKIFGHHNNYNAHFVYTIAHNVFGIEDEIIRPALSDFTALAHRLQLVGSINGVDYIDDSISTIPNATIQALDSVPNAKTVLIGGMDRGINYDILTGYINKHPEYNYIFSYDSGRRIFDSINHTENCYYRENLEEAVKLAASITKSGEAILLSPAAASYGYFKNFEERGDAFKKYCGLS